MNGYLSPRIVQIAGLLGFFASLAYWIISGNQSVLMMSGSLSLILLGQYSRVTTRIAEMQASLGQPAPAEEVPPETTAP